MFYVVYKTTNIINGKFYIGKHQTKNLDDDYIGSGKRLKYAIKKYGVENFHREILFVCKDEIQMNIIEKILVVPDAETNYNLTKGGAGSFFYANKVCTPEDKKILVNREIFLKKIREDKDYKNKWKQKLKKASIKSAPKISRTLKKKYSNGMINPFKGSSHNEITKKKISAGGQKRVGKNNGSFGTCWITNGVENKKIHKEDLDIWLKSGYYRGRI